VVLGALQGLHRIAQELRHEGEQQRAVFGKSLVDSEVIRMLLFGAAMVAMMRLRPAGLLPSAVRKRELAPLAGDDNA
jgi:branched-chain amino acid transport system permease protein